MTLIVNADDLGASSFVNRGVVHAHEYGVVTSASLLVRHAAAEEAALMVRRHPTLDLGLHLDLGEWRFANGAWVPVYTVVDLDHARGVEAECRRQLGRFRQLIGRDPTHLDSHQHVHQRPPVRELVTALGAELGVPVRHLSAWIRYDGSFYGQTAEGTPLSDRVTIDALLSMIARVPDGITELGCHPAEAPASGEHPLETMYRDERTLELSALCDPAVRDAIVERGIKLSTFADVTPVAGPSKTRVA